MFREISKILGYFLSGLTLTLFLPLCLALFYQFWSEPAHHPQPHSSLAFFYTILISAALAAIFLFFGRKSEGRLYRREGLASVFFIWMLTPAIAGLPFLFSGTLENPIQAYFEAASGITTTGASVFQAKKYNPAGKEVPYRSVIEYDLKTVYEWYGTIAPVKNAKGEVIKTGIEAVSKAVLFWRSFLQWLGGVGIVVLFVAILPALGTGGKMLFQSEMAGPVKEGLTPRIKETALALWKIYAGLTLLETALLIMTNTDLTLLDALTITFSTLSTGGFTIINGSIGGYNNANTEWVVIAFMLLGSFNFSLYYYALKGKFFRFYDIELLVFLIIVLISGIYASSFLVGTEEYLTSGKTGGIYSISAALRTGFFQTVSAQTSTGFSSANYDLWPYPIQTLMLILIFMGGMAGSTSGGIKMIRHIMLFRIGQNKVERLFRPETVRSFRVGERSIDVSAAITVLCFFLTIIALSVLGTFLLTFDGLDPETALTTITIMVNNSGLGFRQGGPTDSFAFLNNFGLIVNSLWMIMGRLEFFTILVVLVPAFWREA